MAEEVLQTVGLREDFYRDSFGKVIFIIASVCVAIVLLFALIIYLYLNKPPPITFPIEAEWRIQPDVPVNVPYVAEPDLLQWVSETILKVFIYDFYQYNTQLKSYSTYFTSEGWSVFLNQVNIYANYDNILAGKMFVTAVPGGAPYVVQQGLLAGRYGWWIQMPIDINSSSFQRSSKKTLTLQILVVRVSTLNNLSGVAIDNVIVAKSTDALPG